ncbi:class I SAM-dependent methyltransferase [Lentzea sp. NPDC058450]|uniref:class I SAM-dependent methyltransferase n=1 Tax=Lentzea sp. NPDC058450 TaxID=3346505 RepID=UPI0036698A19
MSSQEVPAVPDSEAERFWENHYAQQQLGGFSHVSPLLVETVEALAPARADATALDLACGRGNDTLWLASQGWCVVAADISPTAIRTVAERAEAENLRDFVRAEVHDLTRTFPEGSFDLISAQHFHTPFDVDRAAILRTAVEALRPGGRLLVVDHGSTSPWSWNQDPDVHFPSPDEVYEELALDPGQWRAVRRDRPQRLATGPNGQKATVTDHVLVVLKHGDGSAA